MMEHKYDESETADPFLQVKGIGPGKARQLREGGVQTLAQLADMTPEAVATIVSGASAHTIQRDSWLEQARHLAAQAGESQLVDDRQRYATFAVELLLDETRAVRRTRVEHLQSGEKAKWAQWHADKLAAFIEERAGLDQPQPAAQPPKATTAASKPSLRGQPQVQALTVTVEGEPRSRRTVPVGRKINLHLEMDLNNVQLPADTAVAYDVMVFARELAGSDRHALGQAEGLLSSSDALLVDVPGEATLPGAYRLEADLKLVTAVADVNDTPATLLQATTLADGAFLHVYA